jgi:hypothetical protein
MVSQWSDNTALENQAAGCIGSMGQDVLNCVLMKQNLGSLVLGEPESPQVT